MRQVRRTPLIKRAPVTTRQLIHEGRRWLECIGLVDALPDPYTVEDVAMFIERFYPSGLKQFAFDITHVEPMTYWAERYRHMSDDEKDDLNFRKNL